MRNYVIINGVNSLTIPGLAIKTLPPITKPLQRTLREEIDGRDGDIITELGYGAYDKTITIGLFGNFNIDNVIAFFNQKGTITFSNESDKVYYFQALDQVDYESLLKFREADIDLHCQPFKYPVTETPIEKEKQYITVEGESITINDTEEAPMKNLLKGNTSQTGTPTPSSPIPVNVVSGDNTIDITGKNLFDNTLLNQEENYNTYNSSTNKWTTNSGGGYARSILYGATGTSSNRNIAKLIKLLPNKTYTLTFYDFTRTTTDNNYLNLAFFDSTGAIIGSSIDAKDNPSFTTPNQECYLDIRRSNNSGTFTFSNIQIEVGSSSTSYDTYTSTTYPINLPSGMELCKIGNYQDKFLRSNGTNLAPINLESETYNSLQITNNNNGTFTLLGNPTGSFGRDIATNLALKAGTYTISANAMPSGLYIALDNEADTQLSSGTLSKTFTLASDTTYTSLGIWFTKNKDYDVTIQLQIEEGSSVTEWQPKEGWYLHKEIGKVVLNGSETWNIFNSNNTRTAFRKDINDIEGYTNENNTPNLTSNRFTPISYNGTWSIGNLSRLINNNAQMALIVIYNPNTSVEDFKTWLASNNTIVYYVLATPTSEGIPINLINQLEQFYQAQSKNNQTNISQINNDLGFIISASALKKGNVAITNQGNIYSKPTINIEGTGNVTIYLNGSEVLAVDLSEENEITIDTEKMEAYTETSLANRKVVGDYSKIKLNPGSNELYFYGDYTQATITKYTRWV